MIGIIGGSGLAKLVGLQNVRREIARTAWGEPSSALSVRRCSTARRWCSWPVTAMATRSRRRTSTTAPTSAALKQAGADAIISVATVGGIAADLGPGTLVVPDQLIDYSTGRDGTYYSGPDQPVVHIDFTQPYDAALRTRLLTAGRRLPSRWSTAAATPACRGRGWRPRPRSGEWLATAATWSG